MPTRLIRDGWVESTRIDQLDAAGERFFLRLCLRADDYGRYHADPRLLRSNLFPLRDDVRSADMTRCLAACEKAGLVRCYQTPGGRYLEIERFNQRTRAKVSKFPPPSDTCPADDGHMRSETETETETNAETDNKPARAAPEPVMDRAELDHQCAQIYDAYPRKVGRAGALPKIRAAILKVGFDVLLERTRAYAVARAGSEVQYTPHPATWFFQERYADDPSTWTANGRTKYDGPFKLEDDHAE